MISDTFRKIFISLVLIAGVIAFASEAYAENSLVQVTVRAPFEATKGVGIIVTTAGTVRKELSKIEKGDGEEYVVSFEADSSVMGRDSYATAILSSEEGDVAYGNMKALSDKVQDINLIKNIPLCPIQTKQTALLESQAGTLQQLVRLRIEKKKLVRDAIASIMTEAMTMKLRGLEKIFGLKSDPELSPDLPALELLNRLNRIATALENVDYHKQFKATPTADSAQ